MNYDFHKGIHIHFFDRAMTAELEKKISPMIRLLDDTDDSVLAAVRRALISEGKNAIPFLRNAYGVITNKYQKDNILGVIREIRQNPLFLLKEFLESNDKSESFETLEQQVVNLSSFGYPETDPDYIHSFLDKVSLEIHSAYVKNSTTNHLTLLMALNQVFFHKYNFRGTNDHYFNPSQSYLYSLLLNKTGIPISLSVLYMLLAERCGIDMYGVNMPLHFLAYDKETDVYIDVFNSGIMLTKDDCKDFLRKAHIEFRDEMLHRASNQTIIKRMIRNLIIAHQKYGDEWEVHRLKELLNENERAD